MKKSYELVLVLISFVIVSSCAQMPAQEEDPIENGIIISAEKTNAKSASLMAAPTIKLSQDELEKYAYEIGLDPRQALSDDQKSQISKRRKLRLMERALDSHKERQQYSKVLPWLKSDDEKLDYLSIPSIEGRQAWINKNKIWSRQKELKNYIDVMESQDIAFGMPTDYVRKSWGDPTHVEVSGNPIYKNERWKYLKQVSTPQGYRQEQRYVYFEGGRVVGWETE